MDGEPNAGGTNPQPEMVAITLNNREVLVPNIPEAIAVLKQADHDLKSGYGSLLDQERSQLKAEHDKLQKYLEEDIEFLATHDPSEYENYAAKLVHGDQGGYIKPPEGATKKMDTPNPVIPNADILALKEKIEKLEQALTNQVSTTAEQQKGAAERALWLSLKQYDKADKDLVITRMENHYYKTGTHPSPEQVMAWAQADHERIGRGATVTPPPPPPPGDTRSALPNAKGGTPPVSTTEKKRVPLLDLEGQMDSWKGYQESKGV